jgi:hypothetical protein
LISHFAATSGKPPPAFFGKCSGIAEVACPPFCAATSSLRLGHQFDQVTVRSLKVDAPAAIPIVELAVVEVPRSAAESQPGLLNATENGVELGVAINPSISKFFFCIDGVGRE